MRHGRPRLPSVSYPLSPPPCCHWPRGTPFWGEDAVRSSSLTSLVTAARGDMSEHLGSPPPRRPPPWESV